MTLQAEEAPIFLPHCQEALREPRTQTQNLKLGVWNWSLESGAQSLDLGPEAQTLNLEARAGSPTWCLESEIED